MTSTLPDLTSPVAQQRGIEAVPTQQDECALSANTDNRRLSGDGQFTIVTECKSSRLCVPGPYRDPPACRCRKPENIGCTTGHFIQLKPFVGVWLDFFGIRCYFRIGISKREAAESPFPLGISNGASRNMLTSKFNLTELPGRDSQARTPYLDLLCLLYICTVFWHCRRSLFPDQFQLD